MSETKWGSKNKSQQYLKGCLFSIGTGTEEFPSPDLLLENPPRTTEHRFRLFKKKKKNSS